MCFSLNTDSLYLLASTLLSNSQQFLPSPNFSAFSPKDDFYKVNNNAFLQLLVQSDFFDHRTAFLSPCFAWRASQVLYFSAVKNVPANAGDKRNMSLIPGWGRCPEGGHGNPLQYSCLENPMDRGAWWASDHRVTKNRPSWGDLPCTHSLLSSLLT